MAKEVANKLTRDWATSKPGARRRFRWPAFRLSGTDVVAFGVLTLLLLIGEIWCVPTRFQRETCARCRALRMVETRRERTPRESRTEKVIETSCSTWYAQNVPVHEHLWIPSPSSVVHNTPLEIGVRTDSYNPRHGPIWILSPEEQLAVYEHAPNREEAQEAFDYLYNAWLARDAEAYAPSVPQLLKNWLERGKRPEDWKAMLDVLGEGRAQLKAKAKPPKFE